MTTPLVKSNVVTVSVWLTLCVARLIAGEDRVDYNRDVRPILSDNCYRCHGPDEGERSTELRLDDEASAFSALTLGGHAVVPGNPGKSELVRRISSDAPEVRMPPPETGKTLSAEQIRILNDWIEAGASWGAHWAFSKPIRPALPSIEDIAWPKNPIDYFVLDRLERKSWKPSERASRAGLIRRATFAVTGLPPTPQQVERFIGDTRPGAYDALIDRLLQSPQYGEHQTRYWLDLARYGDTHGLHLDNERSIWPYRNWVIDAFNRNMPFDAFTVEQLAGDLLNDPTLDQRIATGFHRCNVTTSEGGAIAEEFLARYAVDRVETTSAVWLGLTTGCAACHDHKFDPISQREFYQLFAYFYSQTEKAMDGNAKLPPPSVKAPTRTQALEQKRLLDAIGGAESKVQVRRKQLVQDRSWEHEFAKTFADVPPSPTDWLFHVSGDEITGEIVGKATTVPGQIGNAISLDGSSHLDLGKRAAFDRTESFSLGGWVRFENDGANTILSRMRDEQDYRGYDLYISGGRVYLHLISQWPTDAIRVNTTLPLRKEKWQHVVATYSGSGKASGVSIYVDGVLQETERTHDTLTGSFLVAEPFRIGRRKDSAGFRGAIDELVVFARVLNEREVLALANGNPLLDVLRTPVANRSAEDDARVVDAYMSMMGVESGLPRLRALRKRISQLEQSIPSTLVMEERAEPRDAFILVRGEYDNKGEPVFPAVPAIFEAPPVSSPSRLSLAQWLVDDANPLTARVTANRMWQQYFGVGLVKTAEDFGSQGEWPSHPRLLDYLATELVLSGWDLKAIHRLILTSATFQQASGGSRISRKEDPENRLLSRGPRFRFDAEVIRDFAMSVSGQLVNEIGGPSVKPYQPPGLWNAVGYTSSNTAQFQRDSGAKLYRRGMYTFWKRTSPPPQMQILDAPSREVCTVSRPRTNTPGAALLLMNDVQYVEAARNLAARTLAANSGSDRQRIDFLFRVCLARDPDQDERDVLLRLLAANRSVFDESPDKALSLLSHGESKFGTLSPNELAAWTMVCSTVMNLDEAISQH